MQYQTKLTNPADQTPAMEALASTHNANTVPGPIRGMGRYVIDPAQLAYLWDHLAWFKAKSARLAEENKALRARIAELEEPPVW